MWFLWHRWLVTANSPRAARLLGVELLPAPWLCGVRFIFWLRWLQDDVPERMPLRAITSEMYEGTIALNGEDVTEPAVPVDDEPANKRMSEGTLGCDELVAAGTVGRVGWVRSLVIGHDLLPQ